SPWHSGEVELQAHVGVAEQMGVMGKKVIRDYMPDQHREFYAHLPYMFIGAVDDEGWPWASLMDAQAGFIASPDRRHLQFSRLPDRDDPMGAQFVPGAAVALPDVKARAPMERMARLDDAAVAMIRAADTFFVASYVDLEGEQPHRSVDVSHRGGQPGFVRVEGDVLTIPDFAGNLHFNT
nr:hypothetical protein [Tanacetum cinerariifolium]